MTWNRKCPLRRQGLHLFKVSSLFYSFVCYLSLFFYFLFFFFLIPLNIVTSKFRNPRKFRIHPWSYSEILKRYSLRKAKDAMMITWRHGNGRSSLADDWRLINGVARVMLNRWFVVDSFSLLILLHHFPLRLVLITHVQPRGCMVTISLVMRSSTRRVISAITVVVSRDLNLNGLNGCNYIGCL